MYANPTVNVNMEAGAFADDIPAMMTQLGLDVTKTAGNPDKLGISLAVSLVAVMLPTCWATPMSR